MFMRARRTAVDYFFLTAETLGLLTLVAMSVHRLTNGTETDQICAHPF